MPVSLRRSEAPPGTLGVDLSGTLRAEERVQSGAGQG